MQGANTTDFRDVFVHHNTVTGHTPNFDGYNISSGCILLRTARGVQVSDNNVSFCGYGGIVLDFQSNYNQILRNTITSSGFNPAVSLLVDSSSNNEIKFNKISIDPREFAGLVAGEDTLILEQSVTAGTADNNDIEANLADVALTGGGHSKNYLNTPPSSGATVISNFTNAQHNHQNAVGGGQLTEAALSLSDVTTNNVSTTTHGFAPKAPNDTTKFLRGDGTWAIPTGGSGWTDDGSVVRLTTSSDSVGIGTSSPFAKMDINSTSGGNMLHLGAGPLLGTLFGTGSTVNNESVSAFYVYRAGQFFLRQYVNQFGQLSLQPNGDANVGIGTYTPTAKLHVTGGDVYVNTIGNGGSGSFTSLNRKDSFSLGSGV